MARVDHDLYPEQWAALLEAWGGCAYCGAVDVPLQRDCIQPIAWGGRYTLANVAPACRSCNTSKWNLEVTTWMRRHRLDEPTFLVRHRQITVALQERFPAEP
jgi:5-methylcytosine-specific restriction endonuclease McrA